MVARGMPSHRLPFMWAWALCGQTQQDYLFSASCLPHLPPSLIWAEVAGEGWREEEGDTQ